MSDNLRFPLREHAADQLHAKSERPLSGITDEAARDNELSIADLQISAATLRAQAEIARQAGYHQLGANLARAAELTVVPDSEILRMYELLRPGRASYEALMELASHLEHTYDARESAALVRSAAEVYQARGIVQPAT